MAMPTHNLLEEVQSLKGSARANTTFGDYEEALTDLNLAIGQLRSGLQKIDTQETFYIGYDRSGLLRQLADCYGMAGGVYRRKAKEDRANLEKSIRMYDSGRELEYDTSCGIQNSYNITNSIAVRIIQNAKCLTTQETEIRKAIRTIQKQVEVKRRDEWWAWADLGQLYLLIGQEKEAFQAYAKFQDAGPRARDYVSTLTVLEELMQALKPTNPPIAKSIERVIQDLKKNKPSR